MYSRNPEHRVEHGGELGVTVPDEEPERADPATDVHQQVPRLLCRPSAVRVGRYAEVKGGPEIREPVVSEGPFIMNNQSQIEQAVARYRRGAMGNLAPLSGN